MIDAYVRRDGRKGIRSVVGVAYLVGGAHHVARQIVNGAGDSQVQLIGFPVCVPDEYAERMMAAVCTHPKVGGVLLVSLGCESMDRDQLLNDIQASGRPAELLVIQEAGDRKSTRLNSSHVAISYAVFCLKKKQKR